MAKGLFVGLCGLDVITYGTEKLPIEDTKIKVSSAGMSVGGPAANAAITYRLLSKAPTTIITFIGSSGTGQLLKSTMRNFGITVIDLCEDTDVKCISSIYVNTTAGTRTIFSCRNVIEKLVAYDIGPLVQEADFILYDSHFEAVEEQLLRAAEEYHKDVVVDQGSWKDTVEKLLKHNVTLIASEAFAKNGKGVFELQDIFQYTYAAVTHGGNPIEYQVLGEPRKTIEVPKVAAVDTLGAGDIFHGAYCYFKYCRSASFDEALAGASRVASTASTVYGVEEGVRKYIQTVE